MGTRWWGEARGHRPCTGSHAWPACINAAAPLAAAPRPSRTRTAQVAAGPAAGPGAVVGARGRLRGDLLAASQELPRHALHRLVDPAEHHAEVGVHICTGAGERGETSSGGGQFCMASAQQRPCKRRPRLVRSKQCELPETHRACCRRRHTSSCPRRRRRFGCRPRRWRPAQSGGRPSRRRRSQTWSWASSLQVGGGMGAEEGQRGSRQPWPQRTASKPNGRA